MNKEVYKEMKVVTKYNSNMSEWRLLKFYSEKPFADITDPSGAQFDFVFISTFGFSSEC